MKISGYSLILTAFFVTVLLPAPQRVAAEDEAKIYSAEEIYAFVGETYSRILSAKGTITRITEYGGDAPERFEGKFFMKAPDRLLIRYSSEFERNISFDGRYFRVYFPGDDVGYFTDTLAIGSAERFVLGSGPYIGNILSMYRDSHDIAAADYFEGHYILKATPKSGSGAYVLIGITPGSWTVNGIEQFDDGGRLIRQTRYLDFERAEEKLLFPKTIEISTLQNDKVVTETTYLQGVTLNSDIKDNVFEIKGTSSTDWRERSFSTRR